MASAYSLRPTAERLRQSGSRGARDALCAVRRGKADACDCGGGPNVSSDGVRVIIAYRPIYRNCATPPPTFDQRRARERRGKGSPALDALQRPSSHASPATRDRATVTRTHRNTPAQQTRLARVAPRIHFHKPTRRRARTTNGKGSPASDALQRPSSHASPATRDRANDRQ